MTRTHKDVPEKSTWTNWLNLNAAGTLQLVHNRKSWKTACTMHIGPYARFRQRTFMMILGQFTKSSSLELIEYNLMADTSDRILDLNKI